MRRLVLTVTAWALLCAMGSKPAQKEIDREVELSGCDPVDVCPGPPGGIKAPCGLVNAGCPGVDVLCLCEDSMMCAGAECLATPPYEAGAGDRIFSFENYERAGAAVARVDAEFGPVYRNVMERYGRNDGPDAVRILAPWRKARAQAKRWADHLVGADGPKVRSPKEVLKRAGIPVTRFGAPKAGALEAFLSRGLEEGTIAQETVEKFRLVLGVRCRGIMNPSSLGASEVGQCTAQALIWFGLASATDGGVR